MISKDDMTFPALILYHVQLERKVILKSVAMNELTEKTALTWITLHRKFTILLKMQKGRDEYE